MSEHIYFEIDDTEDLTESCQDQEDDQTLASYFCSSCETNFTCLDEVIINKFNYLG